MPVGRFALRPINIPGVVPAGLRLRSDAATAWEAIVELVHQQGGALDGVYGDCTRRLAKTSKVGTSGFSFHYCGRAVDISEPLANPGLKAMRRYFVVREDMGAETYWRIFCRTSKQDGSQGSFFPQGHVQWWSFPERLARNAPAGHYIDLTSYIESTGTFERIKAQQGWLTAHSPRVSGGIFRTSSTGNRRSSMSWS